MVRLSLLGIPHDDNSSFLKGPSEAPPLIREKLYCDAYGEFSESGFEICSRERIVEHGDMRFDGPSDPWELIEDKVATVLKSGDPLICLGGDHASPKDQPDRCPIPAAHLAPGGSQECECQQQSAHEAKGAGYRIGPQRVLGCARPHGREHAGRN